MCLCKGFFHSEKWIFFSESCSVSPVPLSTETFYYFFIALFNITVGFHGCHAFREEGHIPDSGGYKNLGLQQLSWL